MPFHAVSLLHFFGIITSKFDVFDLSHKNPWFVEKKYSRFLTQKSLIFQWISLLWCYIVWVWHKNMCYCSFKLLFHFYKLNATQATRFCSRSLWHFTLSPSTRAIPTKSQLFWCVKNIKVFFDQVSQREAQTFPSTRKSMSTTTKPRLKDLGRIHCQSSYAPK